MGEGRAEAGGPGVSSLALTCWLEGHLQGCVGQGPRLGSGVGREGRRASPAQAMGGRKLALVERGLFVPRVLMTETWLWRGLPGWNGEECCVGWGVRRKGRPSPVCGLGPGDGASPCREWGPCCAWAQGLTRVRRHKVTSPRPGASSQPVAAMRST